MKLLSFSILFVATILFQDWIVQKIGNRVSVSFPGKPAKQILQGEPYYMVESAGGYKCVVMATDYGRQGVDSANLAVSMATPEALKSSEEGLLRDFKGSKLISSKSSFIAGL